MRQEMKLVLLILVFACFSGCGRWRGAGDDAPLYFGSPEEAVETSARLLRASDWPTLRRYYDLEDSKVAPEDLESGKYFVECPPDEPGTGAPCRYLHPFDPRYTFARVSPGSRKGEHEVVVQIEIQEEGGMKLKGYASFEMRRSRRGWRILPR